MRKLKGDNRGLSLIEVLVVVTILAIIVVPFLHSFVTAATTNSKAKRIHKATVVAQSVMEGVKADTLEALALQFNYPNQGFYVVPSERINSGAGLAAPAGDFFVGELLYDGSTGTYPDVVKYEDPTLNGVADKRAGVTASTYSEDMGATGEFLADAEGTYYFFLEKVKGDATEYDVLVKVDAVPYRSGAAVGVPEYNEDAMAQLPVIDLEQDAMCVQKESYTDAAVENFRATHNAISAYDVRRNLGRTITVTVDKTLVGTEERITVTAEYVYTYWAGGYDWTYPKTKICYDSMETEKDLRSVYLYYYPLYPSNLGVASRDRIIFKNNHQLPVNFYLMKQKSDSTEMNGEEWYNLDLLLMENGSTVDNRKTNVYTNLATNLSTGNPVGTSQYKVYWNWDGNGAGAAYEVPLSSVAPQGVVAAEKQDRMFDIEVSVYESGAKAAGYPEDMRLTTLDGSKTN